MRVRQADGSGLRLFAEELRATRAKTGLSQAELAGKINYSESLVAAIETLRRSPTPDVAERLDHALDTAGTFARLQQHARATPLPAWFRPFADIESTATQLWFWEPMVINGLLQTQDYARAILGAEPNITDPEVEDRAAARMARQAILDRPDPPVLWILMDEAVLIRQVGSAKVMHEQLLHLADMSCRPNITVGIVPLSTGAHSGLLGAFAIAEDNTTRVAFMETPDVGLIVEHAETVAHIVRTFDSLHAEALPRGASRDLLTRRAEEYDRPD